MLTLTSLCFGAAMICRAQARPAAAPPLHATESASASVAAAENAVRSTLDGINSYGWDAVNKGIFINWRRENPDRVQCHDDDCDTREHPTRHDAQNDLRTLANLYWYKHEHPSDTRYDAAIERLSPSVVSRFGHSSVNKGYVYPVLLRLALFAPTPAERSAWVTTIRGWAEANVKRIDPALGVEHRRQGNCDCGDKTIFLDDAYRVGAEVEMGAALVDAGSRFDNKDWVAAGYRMVRAVHAQSFSKEYHLFGRVYVVSDAKYGKNLLWDTQAAPWDVSEEADLLLRAGLSVKAPEIKKFFLDLVAEMLTSMRTLPFHDKVHGGFIGTLMVADGYIGKKGTVGQSGRQARQLTLLGTFHLANRLLTPRNQFTDLEAEQFKLVTHTTEDADSGMLLPNTVATPRPQVNGVPASTGGFMFELTPDFKQEQHPHAIENWISAEAGNLALAGLQEWLADAMTR